MKGNASLARSATILHPCPSVLLLAASRPALRPQGFTRMNTGYPRMKTDEGECFAGAKRHYSLSVFIPFSFRVIQVSLAV
jgi:hypothetical protein